MFRSDQASDLYNFGACLCVGSLSGAHPVEAPDGASAGRWEGKATANPTWRKAAEEVQFPAWAFPEWSPALEHGAWAYSAAPSKFSFK